MEEKSYRMTLLFDFFGDLLTERQREFFGLYYNEDFSLSEIAENSGITRQGVRDVLVRAEAYLCELEDKTGIVRRFESMRGSVAAIESAAEEIALINRKQYGNDRVATLTERILSDLETLKG